MILHRETLRAPDPPTVPGRDGVRSIFRVHAANEVLEGLARLRLEPLIQELEPVDPVGAEVAEVVPELAPRGQHSDGAEEGEAEGTNGAAGEALFAIPVLDPELPPFAERLAHLGEVDGDGFLAVDGGREEAGLADQAAPVAGLLGQEA